MSGATMVKATRAVPEHLREGYDKIDRMTREECEQLWNSLIGKALDILRTRSQLVFKFEREGWNVEGLANGHLHYYRKIGRGELLAELFDAVKDPALLATYAELESTADQERVIRNDEVTVVTGLSESGSPYAPKMKLLEIAPRLAELLCRGRKINDKDTQVRYFVQKRAAEKKPPKCTVKANKRRNTLVFQIGSISGEASRAAVEAELSKFDK